MVAAAHHVHHEAHAAWVQAQLRHHTQTRHLAVRVSWNEDERRLELDGPVPRIRDRALVEQVVRAVDPDTPLVNRTYVITDDDGAWNGTTSWWPAQDTGRTLAA